MIGYFLFFVEENNVCVVAEKQFQPLPTEILPTNLNSLPGDFAIMSYVFQSILLTLFLISLISSITYIQKILIVLKWHKSDPEIYRREAMPFVRRSKIWNSILGLSLTACSFVFMTHAGRVCAGWYLPS